MPPKKAAEPFKRERPEMDMSLGYTHIRNGIFDHTATGQMTTQEYCLYSALLRFAKFKTGVCVTCASALALNFADISEGAARNCLNSLRKKGYIKYRNRSGKRGLYPILIDKYAPGGVMLGWRLNAMASYDMNDPVYEWASSTPISKCYNPDELAFLEAEAELAQVQVRVESELAQMQVECRSSAGQMQVGCRLDALYTTSLLTQAFGHSGIKSLSHSGRGEGAARTSSPSENPKDKSKSNDPPVLFDFSKSGCTNCKLPVRDCNCPVVCPECDWKHVGLDTLALHLWEDHDHTTLRLVNGEWEPESIEFNDDDDDDIA